MTDLANNPNTLEEQALSSIEVRNLQGKWVFDEQGEVIGKIGDVLVNQQKKPEWLIVSMGSFLHEDRLIPVFDMKSGDHGYVLSYTKDMVKRAPVVNVVNTPEDDEQRLFSYWCTTRTAAMPSTCSLLSRN